jgi:nicotinate-nucleotide adenylyltransferase
MTSTRYQLLAKLRARRSGHIGLLGGSFNPAHHGHAHVADTAASVIGLDAVWWLVSPQNPLKSANEMAPVIDRYTSANANATTCRHHRRMVVSRLEEAIGTSYTADTVRLLAKTCPHLRFYFLMGADNLATFHRWYRPDVISRHAIPVVVNRPHYRSQALGSPTAARLKRIAPRRLKHTAMRRGSKNRYWGFIEAQQINLSATTIRAKRKD